MMGGTGKKNQGAKSVENDDTSRKPPPKATEEDDYEDGDIATPKRDRDDEHQEL